jgi:Zn-dependent protease with chaperone function
MAFAEGDLSRQAKPMIVTDRVIDLAQQGVSDASVQVQYRFKDTSRATTQTRTDQSSSFFVQVDSKSKVDGQGKAPEAALTADDVRRLMQEQPLSVETWPAWRDYYERLQFEYEIGEPIEFYDRLNWFVGGLATQDGGTLQGEIADDPVAWLLLSNYFRRSRPPLSEQAMAAARHAVELGDPTGMSSLHLASSLIANVGQQAPAGELTHEQQRQLDEAEQLLNVVERRSPQSRLSFSRGLIHWCRGNEPEALRLLRQGAQDHSHSSYSVGYLSRWMSSSEAAAPYAATTASFVDQFPEDTSILGLHAAALYRDERFTEAYETLVRTREHDKSIDSYLGPVVIASIEQGRWLTPQVLSAIELEEKQAHAEAAQGFRDVLVDDPNNLLAAQLLTRTLVAELGGLRGRYSTAELEKIIDECGGLCERYPGDPELQVAHAATLFYAHRNIEADAALHRARELGGDLNELAGPGAEERISKAAQGDRFQRNWARAIVGGLAASALWLGVMFLLGTVLAVGTARIPSSSQAAHALRSSGEQWLERFYFVVLGLSLLFFYLSVPFVALGLLAITLALFGLMLAIRIMHFGILSRGFFATWGVIRSAFVGPSFDVLGLLVNREQHPQLFRTLQEVAERLDTSPVDEVYLTPSSAIGVYEGGKGPFGLFKRRRVMEIGISTLTQLTTSELKAILAHEYGHFTHQDPFYTRFISQVTMSLANSLAVMNAAGGSANYINPFYWFYWLYLRAYALLASGFSRSREFLADRRAVVAYGKTAFISGLTKVVVDGTVFESTAVQNICSELHAGHKFVNVFDAFRQYRDQPQLADAHNQLLENIRNAKPSWFDSHPTYSERVAAVSQFPETQEQADMSPAVSLLTDFTYIEEQLTDLLTNSIYHACSPGEDPTD